MKTIYRVLVFGLLTMALTAVTASSLFAQDDPCTNVEAKQAVYKKFTDNFASKVLAQRKIAVEAGKEYVEKYGNCPDDKEIVAYLNKNVPAIEKGIAAEEGQKVVADRYNRFNTAINAKNTADIYSVGKEILATDPNLVDVMLVLATAGYDQASAKTPDDKYNGEAVNYAKTAIQKLESGTKSQTGDYGVLTYAYKDKDNAVSWMNYIVGYIDYYRMNKKDEGLGYFYTASQSNSTTKTNPFLYQTLGLSYRNEVVRLGEEIAAKLKANNNQATDETKDLIALQKGYADRAIDAYARAYKVADASNKQYKDGLYNSVKEIYTLRFEGKTDGVDAYIASLTSKPLPDPATKVVPVVEDEATAANSATTTVSPAATTKTPVPNTTKPAATPDNKKPPVTPISSTTKEAATKVTVTKTDAKNSSVNEAKTKDNTSAKKPAPKKKGTR